MNEYRVIIEVKEDEYNIATLESRNFTSLESARKAQKALVESFKELGLDYWLKSKVSVVFKTDQ